jgi:hypothetical protein
MGKSHREPLKKIDKCDKKSVWLHSWEVDHGNHFLSMTTYEEIQGAKEGPTYGIH